MVDYQIHDQPHTVLMHLITQAIPVLERPVAGIRAFIVRDVVSLADQL
jgi:hypothetical protein